MTVLIIFIIAVIALTLAELAIGFVRGFKKSLLRGFFVLGAAVVAFVVSFAFSESITCAVLGMIGLEGSDFPSLTANLISNTGLDQASTGALTADVSALIASVITPVFFLIIYWVLKFLTWIAYLIVSSVRNKKNASETPEASEASNASNIKSRCLGMAVGLGIAAATVIPAVILMTTPVFKLVDVVPDVISLADGKAPETAHDYAQTLSTTRIVMDKVVDSGAISEGALIETVTGVLEKLIDNIGEAVDLSGVEITYTSADEISSDLKALEEIIIWSDESGIFGAFSGDNSSTKLLVEKLDELLLELEKLSFGKQMCDAFTNAFAKELFGEAGAEILNEVADSEEMREVVVQFVDIAPVIDEINSGNLAPDSPEVQEELDKFAEEFVLPENISDEDIDTLVDSATEILSEYGVSEEDILRYAELMKK